MSNPFLTRVGVWFCFGTAPSPAAHPHSHPHSPRSRSRSLSSPRPVPSSCTTNCPVVHHLLDPRSIHPCTFAAATPPPSVHPWHTSARGLDLPALFARTLPSTLYLAHTHPPARHLPGSQPRLVDSQFHAIDTAAACSGSCSQSLSLSLSLSCSRGLCFLLNWATSPLQPSSAARPASPANIIALSPHTHQDQPGR